MTISVPSIRWTNRHRYRGWDGAANDSLLSAEDMLDLFQDEFLNRDPDQVMNQALHKGLGDEQAGLDQARAQLRQQLAEQEHLLSSADLAELAQSLARQAEQKGSPLSSDARQLLQSLSANPGKIVQTLQDTDSGARLELESELQSASAGQSGGGIHNNLDLQQHLSALAEIVDLVSLDVNLGNVSRVGDIEDIDEDLVRQALGETTARDLHKLTVGLQSLADSGYLQPGTKGTRLSARAIQHIGNEMLRQVFLQLGGRTSGEHEDIRSIAGLDRSGTSRDYEFGDHFDLNLGETILNAIKRGERSPVQLQPGDMSIFEREESSRVATVLAIDTSRSMGDRGYLLAAKKLGLTLSTLIRNQFPRDLLYIVGFSDQARYIQLSDLADLTWDRFGLGTNVQDALRSSRTLLRQHSNLQKNLILITDGEPTTHFDAGGVARFSQPPTAEALAATYAEATACARDRVSVLVVLLSAKRRTVKFASEIAHRSAAELIVTDPADLAKNAVYAYGQIRRRQ